MKKSSLLRVLWVVVAFVMFGWAPNSVFAQHGGRGGDGFRAGAGGFHGGGGHYVYSRRYYGAYRGGGYYGWRGGYLGWRGGYWGYPRYGYRWGFGIGFGWGPYWTAYPYAYGSPWWTPYHYPYYTPHSYTYPNNRNNDAPPRNSSPKSQDNSPGKPSTGPAPRRNPETNSLITYVAVSRPTAPLHTTNGKIVTASNYRPRPEVQNAIRAMREMPPYAFQRRVDSGRYSNFTLEEREFVKNASQFPIVWEKAPLGFQPSVVR
jgi:hypothetical protein